MTGHPVTETGDKAVRWRDVLAVVRGHGRWVAAAGR